MGRKATARITISFSTLACQRSEALEEADEYVDQLLAGTESGDIEEIDIDLEPPPDCGQGEHDEGAVVLVTVCNDCGETLRVQGV